MVSSLLQSGMPIFESPLDTGCPCGFQLFNPVVSLQVSHLGVYDDARFPGRSILMLDAHEEAFEDLSEGLMVEFMKDAQKAIQAIKMSTGVHRVNFAILGNTVPHVHAHLIPRYPDMESKPGSSPWDDPRVKTQLKFKHLTQLMKKLQEELQL